MTTTAPRLPLIMNTFWIYASMSDKLRVCLLALCFTVAGPLLADGFTQQWATDAGTHTSNLSVLLAVDAAGDVAVVRPGSSDFGITKYSGSTGAQMWQKFHVNDWGDLIPKGITVDSAGNFIVVGNAYLNPYYFCHLVKFSGSTGDQMWFNRTSFTGQTGHSSVTGVVLDSSNRIYVCGYGQVGGDRFGKVARFSANGGRDWETNNFSALGSYSKFHALSLDASGNIFVTGEGLDGMMAAKIDGSTQALSWSRTFYIHASHRYGVGQAIKTDSSGNVFVTGYSGYASASGFDYVTAKIQGADGSLLWQDNYNGPSNGDDRAYAMILDSSGNPIITGYSYDSSTFNFPFTRKYSASSGTVLWSQRTDYGGLNLSITPAGKLISGGRDYNGGSYRSGVSETNISTGALISATNLPPSFGHFQDPPSSYEPPPPSTLATPDGGFIVLSVNNQTLRLAKFAPDTTTQAPTLTTPASNATVSNPLSVSFTLPEAALAGSVKLSFGAIQLTLANTHLTSGAHSFSFNPANPTASADIASGSAIPSGTYTVTLSYQDTSGNPAATASSSNVTVDLTPPVLADVPANITVNATSASGAVVTYTSPTATDAVDGARPVTCVPASGSTFPIGTTTVTCTSTDLLGNSASATFTVTVNNNAPVVTLTGASPLTFEAAASYSDPGATASDVEDGTLTPVIQSNTVVANVPGSYAVTWRATDSLSATGDATRTVNVVDTTAPVIAAQANVSAAASAASGATVTYPAASATDIVGVASITYSQNSGTVFPIGDTTVTITAKDAANNTSTRTFTVSVLPFAAVVSPTSTNVTSTNATLGGDVTFDGGLPITERGIVLAPTSANSNPQIGGTSVTKLTTGGSTGAFTLSATGLSPSTGYSFRGFVTNSQGTSYSAVASFSTLSDNANLSALVLNTASFTPAFASGTTSYTSTVPYATSSLTVRPTCVQAAATITVNGNAVTSGTDSSAIALNVGSNTLTIVVSAEDTAVTKTYTVTVTRQADTSPGSLDPLDLNVIGTAGYAVVEQVDGKVILAGDFTSVLGTTRNHLARLNTDGTLDTSFNPNPNGSVRCVVVQPDGKLLIAGTFTSIGATERNYAARLNADGTLDTGFDPKPNGSIDCIALQPDGKVVYGGDFTTLQSNGLGLPVSRAYIARVKADGSLDTSFDPKANAAVNSIDIDPATGDLLIGGDFTSLQPNGGAMVTSTRLALLTSAGAINPALSVAANGSVQTVLRNSAENYVLLGGDFTQLNSTAASKLAKLNASYVPFSPVFNFPNATVLSTALYDYQQAIVAGSFGGLQPAGVARNGISLYTGFNHSASFDPNVSGGEVKGVTMHSTGKVWLAGNFTHLQPNGASSPVARALFARLNQNNVSLLSAPQLQSSGARWNQALPVSHPRFEVSTDNGVTYVPLSGPVSYPSQGSIFMDTTNVSLPNSGLLRARGRVLGGWHNGSSGMVERVTPFSGTGSPEIVVELADGTNLESGAQVLFAPTPLKQSSTVQLTIRNTGTNDLRFGELKRSGKSPDQFGAPSVLSSVQAGQSITLSITCNPKTVGQLSALLTLPTNDFSEKTFTLALSAQAVAALPSVTSDGHIGTVKDGYSLAGTVTQDGGAVILERGIVFALQSQTSTPEIGGPGVFQRKVGGTTGSFSPSVQGLPPGTAYRWRAFASNSSGTAYGSVRTFTTGVGLPSIASPTVTNITGTGSTVGGYVSSLGGATSVTCGVLYRERLTASWIRSATSSTSSTGAFTVPVTLLPGRQYEFKAFATNAAGTVETNIAFFSTPLAVPQITTGSVSGVSAYSATFSANVTTGGGGEYERGVVFAETAQNPNPEIGGSQVSKISAIIRTTDGSGSFTQELRNRLRASTSYSIRSYARNTVGTAYGDTLTFTTSPPYPLTVTVDNARRGYNSANPTFTGNVSGIRDGDNITATFSTEATASSVPGTYKISATLNDPDRKLSQYAVTLHPGTLTIDLALVDPVMTPVTARYTGASQVVPVSATMPGVNEGTITFQLSNNGASVGSPVTSPVVKGEAAANYTLPASIAPGSYLLSAAFSGSTGYVARTKIVSFIVIDPPEVTNFNVSGALGPVDAGKARTIFVVPRTLAGNTASSYRGKVTFSSTDPTAVLPESYTFTAADSGFKSFSVIFRRAGTHQITVTDAASAATGSLSGLIVSPLQDTSASVLLGFGYNGYGQLGIGDTTERLTPQPVAAGLSLSQISAGGAHSLAIGPPAAGSSRNRIHAWGQGYQGQLGDRSWTNSLRTTPVEVGLNAVYGYNNFPSGPVAVAAGENHSMMFINLGSGGNVYCWGNNSSAQCGAALYRHTQILGYPDADQKLQFSSKVTAIAAGSYHSLALLEDGTVRSWGDGWLLGTGPLTAAPGQPINSNVSQPRTPTGLSNITHIAAGQLHSLARKSDGTVWAWGNNNNGQLGTGTEQVNYTPTQVKGPGGTGFLENIVAISAGDQHSVALAADGTVYAWGVGADGQLGNNSPYYSRYPSAVKGINGVGTLTGVAAIACGRSHTLALLNNGTVAAWGLGRYGQLGNSSTASSLVPVLVSGVQNAVSVASGAAANHSFIIKEVGNTTGFEVAKPAEAQSGVPFSFTLTAIDAQNSQVGYLGTVSFSSDDPNATLPAAYTFTSADKGSKTFTATLSGAGSNRIFVSDGKALNQTLTLPTTGAASKISVASMSMPTSTFDQTMALDCLVMSTAPSNTAPKGGLCKATVKTSGGTVIGQVSVSGAVTAGNKVAIYYTLPANTPAGTYTIEVTYSGDTFYNTSTGTGTLRVGVNGVSTGIGSRNSSGGSSNTISSLGSGGSNLSSLGRSSGGRLSGGSIGIADAGLVIDEADSTTFSLGTQNVTLTASVSTGSGTVNEGEMTFTLVNGNGDVVGSSVSAPVLNDQAAVSYALPAALPAAEYLVQLSYSGSPTLEASEGEQVFTVYPAESIATVTDAVANYSAFTQNVQLHATVVTTAGALNSGTVSFQLKDPNGDNVGTAVNGSLSNGEALAVYALPAGLLPAPYTIEATFSGVGSDVLGSTDSAHTLTIEGAAASTTVSVPTVNATFSDEAQTVVLNATVSSNAGIANDGVVSFQLIQNGVSLGDPFTSDVVTNGAASVSIELAAGAAAGTYVIEATYTGGFGLETSSGYGSLVVTDPAEARLASLTFNDGTITPVFDANTYTYTVEVPKNVFEVSVTASSIDSDALVQVNTSPAATGFALTTVQLRVGTNVIPIQVTAPDGVTNRLYNVSITQTEGGLKPLTVSVLPSSAAGAVTFSPRLSSTGMAVVGRTYTVTAKAKTGFFFDSWGGKAAGTSVSTTFTFADGDTVVANFSPSPFTSDVAGKYNSAVAGASTEASGLFIATLSQTTGAITARLSQLGTYVSFAGKLDFRTLQFTSPAVTDGHVASLTLNPTTKRLSGTITEMVGGVAGTVHVIDASKTYDRTTPPTTGMGVYNAAFSAPTSLGTLTAEQHPQGSGYGVLSIGITGTVTVTGLLADGTAWSSSTSLGLDQSISLYAVLRSSRSTPVFGALAGTATLDTSAVATDVTGSGIKWFSSARSSQYYPVGYEGGLSMNLIGALRSTSTRAALGLSSAPTVVFSGGPFASPLSVGLNGTTLLSTDRLTKLTFSAKGLMTGEYKADKTAVKHSIRGIIVGKGGTAEAYGYILSPLPKVIDGTGLGGLVELNP